MGKDKPWYRQTGGDGEPEPMMWYDRFDRYYRPQGPERTLLAAYNAWRKEEGDGGQSKSVSGSWYRAFNEWRWQERAEAWDEAQITLRREAERKATQKMLERHINLATMMQTAAARRLQRLAEEHGDWPRMSVDQMRLLIKDAADLERQARGLPEHLLAVSQMTDDELFAKYRELLERAGGVPEGDAASGAGPSDGDEQALP